MPCGGIRRKSAGAVRHIRKQREDAYKRIEEAKATAKYMDEKVAHYEAILAGLAPDDTNPKNWTEENRPKHGLPYNRSGKNNETL